MKGYEVFLRVGEVNLKLELLNSEVEVLDKLSS